MYCFQAGKITATKITKKPQAAVAEFARHTIQFLYLNYILSLSKLRIAFRWAHSDN